MMSDLSGLSVCWSEATHWSLEALPSRKDSSLEEFELRSKWQFLCPYQFLGRTRAPQDCTALLPVRRTRNPFLIEQILELCKLLIQLL